MGLKSPLASCLCEKTRLKKGEILRLVLLLGVGVLLVVLAQWRACKGVSVLVASERWKKLAEEQVDACWYTIGLP